MKYSAEGKFLLQIGQAGDTAGRFSRPKGVAVDDKGNVYVSDSLLAAVQVFDPSGKFVGVIGRQEAGNRESDSLFSAPAEMKIIDGLLYVTDRLAGLFVFDIKNY
jgi:DNA-binding beta-propeller fold protein YncE